MTSRLMLIQKAEIKAETTKSKKLDRNFNVHPFLQLLFIYLFRSHIYEVLKNLYCSNLSNKFAAKGSWFGSTILFVQRISCFSFRVQTAQHWKCKQLTHFLFFVTTTPSSCVEMKNRDGWMRRTQRKDKELIGPAGGTC